MLRLAYLAGSLAIAALAGGCTLHFGDDSGGDDGCTGALHEPAPTELRNPETLECQTFSTGSCGDSAPIPTWGACDHPCNSLDATNCMLAAECRAVYDDFCWTHDAVCPLEDPFLGCFPVDQQGPVGGGSCTGLDATTCSMHNDCIALHTEQCTGGTCYLQFIECVPEPTLSP